MAKQRKPHIVVARVPGVELLRLCHLGAASPNNQVHNAVESIFSLLSLSLQEEMVNIPEEMMGHYAVLLANG